MMVRFDRIFYRITSSAGMVILMYIVFGWDVREPCAAFGFLISVICLQEWMLEKKKALMLGKAKRAKENKTKIIIA